MSDVNMEELEQKFIEEYEFLYDADCNNVHVAGYGEALEFGEKMLQSQDALLIEFVKWREDFLTSDRELAAFAFAVTSLGLR